MTRGFCNPYVHIRWSYIWHDLLQAFSSPNNPFVLWFPMMRTDVFLGVDSVTSVSSGLSMPVCNQQHTVLFTQTHLFLGTLSIWEHVIFLSCWLHLTQHWVI